MENFSELIIAETAHYIAINKPSGIIVESNPFESALEDHLQKYLAKSSKNPFIGIVHRLDRVTSGLILFAKKKGKPVVC